MTFTFSKELTDYYQADTAATAIHGFISGLYEQPMISITLKNSTPRSKKYMLSVEMRQNKALTTLLSVYVMALKILIRPEH